MARQRQELRYQSTKMCRHRVNDTRMDTDPSALQPSTAPQKATAKQTAKITQQLHKQGDTDQRTAWQAAPTTGVSMSCTISITSKPVELIPLEQAVKQSNKPNTAEPATNRKHQKLPENQASHRRINHSTNKPQHYSTTTYKPHTTTLQHHSTTTLQHHNTSIKP